MQKYRGISVGSIPMRKEKESVKIRLSPLIGRAPTMYIVLYGELYDIIHAYRVCIMYIQIKELKKTCFTFLKTDTPSLSLSFIISVIPPNH